MVDWSKAPYWATEARWCKADKYIAFTGNGMVTYKDGSENKDNLGAEAWGYVIATRPTKHKTVWDAVEWYKREGLKLFYLHDVICYKDGRYHGAMSGSIMAKGETEWEIVCTRDEFEKAWLKKHGQEWTHVWRGINCRIISDKEDALGQIPVLMQDGVYDAVKAANVKPIKPTITKAEAWDILSDKAASFDVRNAWIDLNENYNVK